MSKDGFAATLVPIDKVRPPIFQSRMESLNENLDELVESIKTHGLLEPIIIRLDKDLQPELVSGMRRLKASEKAGLRMVPVVIRELTDEEVLQIQGSENLNRNDLTDTEKTRFLSEWAKRGYDAKTIATKIHKSYSFVVKYLPSQFKDQQKAEAGQIGGEVKAATHRVAQLAQTTASEAEQTVGVASVGSRVEPKEFLGVCEAHHISEPVKHRKVNGEDHLLCDKYLLHTPLETIQGFFRTLSKEHNGELPKMLAPAKPRDFDGWTQKRAHMEVPVSKAEIELGEELANDSLLRPITHQSFTLGPTTTPDWYLPRHNIAVYYDGKVHEGHEDRDDELRNMLTKWHPEIRVCTVNYKMSKKEQLEKIRKMV